MSDSTNAAYRMLSAIESLVRFDRAAATFMTNVVGEELDSDKVHAMLARNAREHARLCDELRKLLRKTLLDGALGGKMTVPTETLVVIHRTCIQARLLYKPRVFAVIKEIYALHMHRRLYLSLLGEIMVLRRAALG